MSRLALIIVLLFVFALTPPARTQESAEPTAVVPDPVVVTKSMTGRFNGTRVSYSVTAGETYLKDDDGKPIASIFSTSYVADDLGDPTQRPVLFIFNGGPGSSSVWLHLGVFGPKRVVIPSDAENPGAAPYDLVDNEAALLDIADMVMIDPVGTGWSQAIGEGKGEDFWGINEDATSVANFIRLWLTKNDRWNSPKYLAGESYGTTRAAAVTHKLTSGYRGITVNGLMLISSILDFSHARWQPGNEMPYIGYLPTYAATAVYHGAVKLGERSLEDFLDEVRDFALGDYAQALLMGNRLAQGDRAAVIDKLARYTGLSKAYLENTDLRINNMRFMKELLRDREVSVGRLDGRFVGVDYDAAGEFPDSDPSGYAIEGAYTATLNDYMGRILGVPIEREYQILSGKPGSNWNWSVNPDQGWPAYVNVAPWVGQAMRENKDMRVWIANGYYDMATPFFATENTFATNAIPNERVIFDYYEAGHMMYIHHPSFEKMTTDMRRWLTADQ